AGPRRIGVGAGAAGLVGSVLVVSSEEGGVTEPRPEFTSFRAGGGFVWMGSPIVLELESTG
ncbi:MAG: hypothetical protein ACPGTU_16880, partial [Myxococcota bacterium]